jgi:hypothetical protein
MTGNVKSQYRTYSEARAGGQLLSCGDFGISRFVIAVRPTWPGSGA